MDAVAHQQIDGPALPPSGVNELVSLDDAPRRRQYQREGHVGRGPGGHVRRVADQNAPGGRRGDADVVETGGHVRQDPHAVQPAGRLRVELAGQRTHTIAFLPAARRPGSAGARPSPVASESTSQCCRRNSTASGSMRFVTRTGGFLEAIPPSGTSAARPHRRGCPDPAAPERERLKLNAAAVVVLSGSGITTASPPPNEQENASTFPPAS